MVVSGVEWQRGQESSLMMCLVTRCALVERRLWQASQRKLETLEMVGTFQSHFQEGVFVGWSSAALQKNGSEATFLKCGHREKKRGYNPIWRVSKWPFRDVFGFTNESTTHLKGLLIAMYSDSQMKVSQFITS